MRFKVATKIIIISTVLAAVFFGSLLLFILVNVRSNVLEVVVGEIVIDMERYNVVFSNYINNTKQRVRSISGTPPIQGMIRAQKNEGLDELHNSTFSQWQQLLSDIFYSEIKTSKLYSQLRYLNEDGQEIVRVDYENNQIIRVVDDKLQNKKDRLYFIESKNILNQADYFSVAELNREGSPPIISKPYAPVVRYIVGVYDEVNDSKQGILAANIRLEAVFSEENLKSSLAGDIYVVDSDGYYIVNPDKNKEWGGPTNLNTGFNMFSEFVGIEKSNFSENNGNFIFGDSIFVYSKIFLDASYGVDQYFNVIKVVKVSEVLKPINRIIYITIIFALALFIILFLAFYFSIHFVMSPLNKLIKITQHIGRGEFDKITDVKSDDEIATLSKSINEMSDKIKNSQFDLEKKVEERTRDLEKINKLMVGRELKMVELKKENIKLKKVKAKE